VSTLYQSKKRIVHFVYIGRHTIVMNETVFLGFDILFSSTSNYIIKNEH